MSPDAAAPDPGDPVVRDLLRRCRFPAAGAAVRCGVSGGADSTALLALSVAAGLRVTAVHVDHGLRLGSAQDAERVADLAARWGAAFESHRAALEDGPDLEARARAARHALLGPGALVGHTADDRAETVVLRLLRGTGPAGLAALDPDRHPLRHLRRSDTVALCAHLGEAPLVDPANADPRFTRVRVRAEVLPLLGDVAGRDVVPLLCRLADLAEQQADAVDAVVGDVDPTDVAALCAAGDAVAAEALRRWWARASGEGRPPDRAATGRMLGVVHGRARSCDVVHGWTLSRRAGRLRLSRRDTGPGAAADHTAVTR